MTEGTHPCVATGCKVTLPAHVLMCRPHWHLVPTDLRTRIFRLYRPGQTAATASPEYLQALLEAVKAVPAHWQENPSLTNECLISACGTRLPARALVCRNHWRLLPHNIRRAVAYLRTAPGREPTPERVRQVAEAATAAVRQAEASQQTAAETPRTQGEHSS